MECRLVVAVVEALIAKVSHHIKIERRVWTLLTDPASTASAHPPLPSIPWARRFPSVLFDKHMRIHSAVFTTDLPIFPLPFPRLSLVRRKDSHFSSATSLLVAPTTTPALLGRPNVEHRYEPQHRSHLSIPQEQNQLLSTLRCPH